MSSFAALPTHQPAPHQHRRVSPHRSLHLSLQAAFLILLAPPALFALTILLLCLLFRLAWSLPDRLLHRWLPPELSPRQD
jgi:hypothetical protein